MKKNLQFTSTALFRGDYGEVRKDETENGVIYSPTQEQKLELVFIAWRTLIKERGILEKTGKKRTKKFAELDDVLHRILLLLSDELMPFSTKEDFESKYELYLHNNDEFSKEVENWKMIGWPDGMPANSYTKSVSLKEYRGHIYVVIDGANYVFRHD